MGWEKRGRQRYFYQKVRIGQRVLSKYVGDYAEAQQARLRQQARSMRDQRREQVRQQLEDQLKLDELVTNVDELAHAIVQGAFLAAGYYLHHREWRKRCQK